MKRASKRKIGRRAGPVVERDWEVEAMLWLWLPAPLRAAEVPVELGERKLARKR